MKIDKNALPKSEKGACCVSARNIIFPYTERSARDFMYPYKKIPLKFAMSFKDNKPIMVNFCPFCGTNLSNYV